MKRFLLPLLLLCNPAPVQAIERGAFLSLLHNAGVSVVERPYCGRERNNVAVYYLDQNSICISKINTPNYRMLDRALTHEAVHAAQDCLGGQRNGTLQSVAATAGYSIEPFIRMLPASKLHMIRSSYPRHMWTVEVEAYALEGRPDDVAELLAISCS